MNRATALRPTAGPWKYERQLQPDDRIHYVIMAPGHIGVMYYIEDAQLTTAAPAMRDALEAIRDMQITTDTDRAQVLALCRSIAKTVLAAARLEVRS